ncbi:hypothetical protein HZA42_03180 [Candidatus Peregrinibacteria bacterium]|nr:hypothetical protein [Candidatus Peregrinibacteria bacterium]
MTLDEQYQKTIDDQRTNLMILQAAFNKVCDNAKAQAEEKLKTVPQEDKEGREAVLKEQKDILEAALRDLKIAVDTSTRETMKKLEIIMTEKEKAILADLEKQMASL